jgi:hypothetical protein
MHRSDVSRGLRAYHAWLLYRFCTFLLGCGVLLGLAALAMGLWFFGIPILVGSLVLYHWFMTCLGRWQ